MRRNFLDALETKIYVFVLFCFLLLRKNKRNYLAKHRLRWPRSYWTFVERCRRQHSLQRNLFGDQILHFVICTGECKAMNLRAEFDLQKHYYSWWVTRKNLAWPLDQVLFERVIFRGAIFSRKPYVWFWAKLSINV